MNIVRYKFPLIVAGAVIIVLLVAYVGWISRENAKLSTINAQKASLASQEQSLSSEIATLKTEGRHVHTHCSLLSSRLAQVPPAPDQSTFLDQIDALARSSGSSLPGFTFTQPTPTSGATPSTSTITSFVVTLNFSGTYSEVTAFLSGLDTLPRLYAVTSYAIKQSSSTSYYSSSGAPIIIPASAVQYDITLIGNIYYNPSAEPPQTVRNACKSL